MSVRVGIGYDSHRLIPGQPLILGGVNIPSSHGPDAHSDGDVLAHAITDALLGAAALGDIGTHFPDTDERWRGADSLQLLGQVRVMLAERGLEISNLDATVVIEEPRLAPHREAMRERLAGAVGIAIECVSVKATTGEGLGFVGRGEGIAAFAVASLAG